MEGWADIKNAAKYADVSATTMRAWLKQGLKHSRLPSRMIRIKYSDIDAFLQQFTVHENEVDRIVDEVCAEFGVGGNRRTRKSK